MRNSKSKFSLKNNDSYTLSSSDSRVRVDEQLKPFSRGLFGNSTRAIVVDDKGEVECKHRAEWFSWERESGVLSIRRKLSFFTPVIGNSTHIPPKHGN